MKETDMSQRYRKFKRTWGTYYAYDNVTGNSVSLKTRVKAEADQKVNAMNEAEHLGGSREISNDDRPAWYVSQG